MKTRNLIVAGIVLIAVTLIFSSKKKHKPVQEDTGIEETEAAPLKPMSAPAAPPTSAASADVGHPLVAPSTTSAPPALSETVLRQFSAHVKTMNKCLGLSSPQGVAEKMEPTADNLRDTLRSAIGEVVMQMDDWSQTEIVDKDSVRKRVRVDYDYLDGDNPSRRLSLYKINSYGMPEIMDLPVDENNANEAVISSLIDGNRVITEEKAMRAYFTNGEELMYSVKNGSLQNMNVTKGEHSFSCVNLDMETSSCSCN